MVAVSDWMRAVPDLISRWVPGDYTSLGTDGFGMSDTRHALRRHFHVDAESIVVATLRQLALRGEVAAVASRPRPPSKYAIDDVNAAPSARPAATRRSVRSMRRASRFARGALFVLPLNLVDLVGVYPVSNSERGGWRGRR